MKIKEIMMGMKPYVSNNRDMPLELQDKAKMLCWKYNQTSPDEKEKRKEILKELLGTYTDLTFIEPSFHCDYGFNIHSHGLLVINYNCVILDTSPVNIGNGVFIGPGTVLACSGHSLVGEEKSEGIGTSAPITLEDEVWLGANVTVNAGVIIGKGSVIGSGSVVTKNIPAGVVAVGNPCHVLRKITEEDRIKAKCVHPEK